MGQLLAIGPLTASAIPGRLLIPRVESENLLIRAAIQNAFPAGKRTCDECFVLALMRGEWTLRQGSINTRWRRWKAPASALLCVQEALTSLA